MLSSSILLGANLSLKIPSATLGFYRHSLKPTELGRGTAGALISLQNSERGSISMESAEVFVYRAQSYAFSNCIFCPLRVVM